MRRSVVAIAVVGAMVALVSNAFGSTPGADVRLSQDASAGGYVSAYTLGTGNAYTDPTLQECSISRGRQNEPAVGVDPRDTRVIIGSSNDYCGVYAPPGDPTTGNPAGPIWLGYYRSENSGSSFVSSLVPGYPGDVSPFASLAHIDTDSSGDPVIAWDAHGRVFMGSESDTGTDDSNGDVWVARYANSGGGTVNDGKLYQGTVTVGQGSQSPFLLGKFNDKTAIEADRTGGPFDGNVYFAWARFTGGKISNIYFVRSTDHGVTFSKPMNLTPRNGNLQDPEISVTAGGDVYVTFDTFASNNGQPFGLWITKSTDGGQTFSPPTLVTTYLPVDAQDTAVSGGSARDCGSLTAACLSGYTFFRHTTSLRSTADQYDTAHQYVYLVYGAVKPGTEVSTGTTFGVESAGVGGQETAYFVRYDGATGTHTAPVPLRNEAVGHQIFPDISADGGVLHAMWWDTRNDPTYSPARPPGNDASGNTVPSLDVYARSSTNQGDSWSTPAKITDVRSNGNYEQFSNRTVPFGGDYLYVSSFGSFAFGTWTDWRNVVAGTDPREDGDGDGADVAQCRAFDPSTGTYGPDTCPHAGGLDQNIYGDLLP
jgi:hypothetical protein